MSPRYHRRGNPNCPMPSTPNSPGFSACGCCGRTWNGVKEHSTMVGDGTGAFPLCEDCWQHLGTYDARKPFYDRLVDDWKSENLEYGYMDKDPEERRQPLLEALRKESEAVK